MTALAANKEIIEKQGNVVNVPVVASDIIYKGALCKYNAAGYLAPCATESGAFFAGIAEGEADNSSGSAGDKYVNVKTNGVFLLTGSSFAQSDLGTLVYASDDATITKTDSGNLQPVGRIVRYVSSTQVWVSILGSNSDLGSAVEVSEVTLAEGNVLLGNASGVGSALDASGDAKILIGNGTTITSVAVSGDVTISNSGAVTIAAGAVELSMLASAISPSHVVKYAGTFTTVGGDAAETISVAGVVATDIVQVMIKTEGASPVTCDAAAAATDQIDVTMSADPSNDHVLQYVVFRATS